MATTETEDMLKEAQMLLLCMRANAKDKQAEAARAEIINIVKAWRRGQLLSKSEAPILMGLYAEARFGRPRRKTLGKAHVR
jgi:hypothetical protein